jgi:hypothetical protein
MSWVLLAGATWVVLGAAIALLVARSIHLADTKAADLAREPDVVVDPAAADEFSERALRDVPR